ncbi:glutathione transferase GST 23 [Amborella trichopoda]|uniref:glutathione transferase GST 23 n=1 Tax=Amborella trichopoda TaxID=13333 RepID=UPI0005D33721|nr:glutathione transferase GST 23 [Amborella trichopoda]|eukprot:XP_011620695.1 glutathione transferase GST 23 [Amborella trichopoda]
MGSVKVHGMWACSYTQRVLVALKLKGVEFEYIEEDSSDKSPTLSLYNPIYEKVPILVHEGKAVVESVVILEYIEETWRHDPLMPENPYDRALIRFWVHFVEEKLGPAVGSILQLSGEEQSAAIGQARESLRFIEAELTEGQFKGRKFFGGNHVGILDIVLGCGSFWLKAMEEDVEVKIYEEEAFPMFHAWVCSFEELPQVKETIPDAEKFMDYAKALRKMMLNFGNP